MENDILATQSELHYGFKMEYSLVANYGLGYFFSKWKEVEEPASDTITDDNCTHWTCLYLEIGTDMSKEDALKEFYRDSEAFDVDVICRISKCDIVLLEEHIIGADYSYIDGSAQELLEELVYDYSFRDELIDKANEKLLALVESVA